MGWQGEIVLSVFLRFVKLRQNLFVETSYFLLPPLKQEYYKIDEIPTVITPERLFKLILESFAKTLVFPLFGFIFLLIDIISPFHKWIQTKLNRRAIRENSKFDYGATTSVREIASSNSYHHYFQELDKEMFLKIVEKQIFDSITDFLDALQIDTSELKSRENTVLNNGVIVLNGNITTGGDMAVGEGAQNIRNNIKVRRRK
jgi:hypothetical protein